MADVQIQERWTKAFPELTDNYRDIGVHLLLPGEEPTIAERGATPLGSLVLKTWIIYERVVTPQTRRKLVQLGRSFVSVICKLPIAFTELSHPIFLGRNEICIWLMWLSTVVSFCASFRQPLFLVNTPFMTTPLPSIHDSDWGLDRCHTDAYFALYNNNQRRIDVRCMRFRTRLRSQLLPTV